jgi:hypothetical protein
MINQGGGGSVTPIGNNNVTQKDPEADEKYLAMEGNKVLQSIGDQVFVDS